MKRILLGTLFTVVSINAMAEAPGGPNCGWGNMLFEGQRAALRHTSWLPPPTAPPVTPPSA